MTAVSELLSDLRHRGAQVHAKGDRVRVRAPSGAVPLEVRERLSQKKKELLEHLQKEDRLLGLDLSQFEREGCPLEIGVPGLDQTLFFVPTERDAEALARTGIRRGRIWTASELRDLYDRQCPPEEVLSIARVKLAFSATIVDVKAGDGD